MRRLIVLILLVSACASAAPSAAGQANPCSSAGTSSGSAFCLARLHGRKPYFRVLPTHRAKSVVVTWSFQCPAQMGAYAGSPRFRLVVKSGNPKVPDVTVTADSKISASGVKTMRTKGTSTILIFVLIDASPTQGPTSICRWNLTLVGKR